MSVTTEESLRSAALALAESGLPVLALTIGGKRPATPHGVNDATTDRERVGAMWDKMPDANIGVALGDGYVVIDIDGPSGEAALRELERQNEALPTTLRTITGRIDGGLHLWFATPEHFPNRCNALGPNLDVRSKGTFVVVPPSIHATGTPYRWSNHRNPAELPEWLARRMRGAKVERVHSPSPDRLVSVNGSPAIGSPYGLAGLKKECFELAASAAGSRNVRLNNAALACGQLLAGGELVDERHTIDCLLKAAAACGLVADDGEAACLKTVASGMRKGFTEPRKAPGTGKVVPEIGDGEEDRDWRPLDLIALAAKPPTPPSVLGIFYTGGARHVLSGEPESLKSWIALAACAQQISAGRHAVWIDTDSMGPGALLERLEALGLDHAAIRERFAYVAPAGPQTQQDALDFAALLEDRHPSLVVVDSFEATLSLYGAESNAEVETFLRRVVEPLRVCGAAVILIDHLTKAREVRGKYSIGAQRKIAGVEVHLEAQVVQPFDRGGVGNVRLKVHKDRHGFHNRPTAAEITFESNAGTGAVGYVVRHPASGDREPSALRPTHLMERVSLHLEDAEDWVGRTKLRSAIRGKTAGVVRAIDVLVEERFLETRKGPRGSNELRILRAYREATDSTSTLGAFIEPKGQS